eukprot:TRINITY_DN11300_c0_g1_i1.p1 TRINITY_DN11300_c0_g1~~TRINITY_DN11300_c0_g1_i1.p1  ORF type:complete len:148 (-),score=30.05 TRINITY_DN11300_c0_g1_i1:170-613(-)
MCIRDRYQRRVHGRLMKKFFQKVKKDMKVTMEDRVIPFFQDTGKKLSKFGKKVSAPFHSKSSVISPSPFQPEPPKPKEPQSEVTIPSPINLEGNHQSVECKICFDDKVDMLFMPCKHACCCSKCGKTLQICPICRQEIVSRIDFVLS